MGGHKTPIIQQNARTGAIYVTIPKKTCVKEGIYKGTEIEFVRNEKGRLEVVITEKTEKE